MDFNELTTWITATGAVGTAAFGILESLKSTWIGTSGSDRIKAVLGPEYWEALKGVYGEGLDDLVRETFRRGTEPLSEMLKTGLRLSLVKADTAKKLGAGVPRENGEPELGLAVAHLRDGARKALAADATASQTPTEAENRLESESRAVLGRFEALMGARVDAAVCAAQRSFSAAMQRYAIVIAVGGSLAATAVLDVDWWQGLLVGVEAVPVAPVAKDPVGVLGHSRTALRARSSE